MSQFINIKRTSVVPVRLLFWDFRSCPVEYVLLGKQTLEGGVNRLP